MKKYFVLFMFMVLSVAKALCVEPYIDEKLILNGEMKDDNRSAVLPIEANIKGGQLDIDFSKSLGDMSITVTSEGQSVYTSLINVSATQQLSISVGDYASGTYLLEIRNQRGGYLCGVFTVE